MSCIIDLDFLTWLRYFFNYCCFRMLVLKSYFVYILY